ncbi:unnamed protein product, partial [Nesidiocoris tenuis]
MAKATSSKKETAERKDAINLTRNNILKKNAMNKELLCLNEERNGHTKRRRNTIIFHPLTGERMRRQPEN